jgi:hypothetical protein
MPEASLPAMVALPRSVTCAGKEILCHPLTIEDIALWDQWARHDFLKSTLSMLDTHEDWKSRTEYRTAALEEARRISLGSPKAFGAMTSVSGKLQICWLSMRKGNNASLTAEQAWQLIAGEKVTPQSYRNLNTVYAEALIASGFMEEADAQADPSTLATKLIDLMMVR